MRAFFWGPGLCGRVHELGAPQVAAPAPASAAPSLPLRHPKPAPALPSSDRALYRDHLCAVHSVRALRGSAVHLLGWIYGILGWIYGIFRADSGHF